MRLSHKLLPVALVAGIALAMPAAPANASVIQDPNSGTCYLDIQLETNTLALSTSDGQIIRGTASNPNNCQNPWPATFYLTDADGNTREAETQSGTHQFWWEFNSGTVDDTALGKLTVASDVGGYYYFKDADGANQNGALKSSSQPTVTVKMKSKLSLSAARSGKYVTLKAKSTRWEYVSSYDINANWVANRTPVSLQKFKGSKWVTVKTVKPNAAGAVSYKFKNAKKAKYRAVSPESGIIWASTSASHTK